MTSETPLNLKEVIDHIESSWDELRSYSQRSTGKIIPFIPEECRNSDEDYELTEQLETHGEDYIELPNTRELDELHLMRRFAADLPDERRRRELLNDLKGRGLYRRFKDNVRSYGLIEEWYQYRGKAMAELARSWCIEYSLPYTED